MTKNNRYQFDNNFAEKVAKIIFESLTLKLRQKEYINIALSGGNTPLPILEKLTDYDLNWKKINFFLVDERCVPISNQQSNYGNISKVFFNKIEANAYSMVKGEKTYGECAVNYENIIKETVTKSENGLPEFDLIFLGMGNDGHTASLFPNTKGLNEKTELIFLNEVPQLNTTRITFSYPLILNAKEIVVLVSGEKKKEIVNEIYEKKSNTYPINKIADEHKNLKWYISK